MKGAISELQGKGYDIPDYPDDPATDEERQVHARFGRVLGSARQPGSCGRATPTAVLPTQSRSTANAIPTG